MDDTALGLALLGLAMVFVLAVVFVVSSRAGAAGPRPSPPPGVHLPNPSWLPVLFSVGAILIGAGLAFKPADQAANLWLLVPGLAVFALAAVGWVRAAGSEWREAERGGHGAHAADQHGPGGERHGAAGERHGAAEAGPEPGHD